TETISAAVPVGQRHTITHVGAIAVQEPLLLPIAEPIMPRPSNCQLPGTPFKLWVPRSSNRRPDPATRSLTVLDTNTSSSAARARMRLQYGLRYHRAFHRSPHTHQREHPREREYRASTIARPQRTARAGPSNDAKKPSPAVSISRPRCPASVV